MNNPLEFTFMSGVDFPMPDCGLIIHQPKLKEIAMLGEQKFFQGTQLIIQEKDPEDDRLTDVSDFTIFSTILNDKRLRKARDVVMDTLVLYFPKYNIRITPRALSFNLNDIDIIIDEDNFGQLQAIIRQICCLGGKDGDSFNPANNAAAEIAKKLMRGRKRVAAQRAAENQGSTLGLYTSVVVVALGVPLSEVLNWTIFQIYDIVERYSLYTKQDIYIRQLLAGGEPESEPDNWMKVIH